jgi:hypothetical protein
MRFGIFPAGETSPHCIDLVILDGRRRAVERKHPHHTRNPQDVRAIFGVNTGKNVAWEERLIDDGATILPSTCSRQQRKKGLNGPEFELLGHDLLVSGLCCERVPAN